MSKLKRICVFCGASLGGRPDYKKAAEAVGQAIAKRGIGVVYGGASIGLMGTVANAALAEGGDVIGVLPKAIADFEIAHEGLTELRIVGSMHERKTQMADLSDAFIVLPGGIGTLEEMFEVWTWSKLNIHAKPVGLLNVGGFYNQLTSFMDLVTAESFLTDDHRAILQCEEDPDVLIDKLEAAELPNGAEWVEKLKR